MSNTLIAFEVGNSNTYCDPDYAYSELPFSATKGVPSIYKFMDQECSSMSFNSSDDDSEDCRDVIKYKHYSYHSVPRKLQEEDRRVQLATSVYNGRFEYPDYKRPSAVSNLASGAIGSVIAAAGFLYSHKFDDEFLQDKFSNKTFTYIDNALHFIRKKWLIVAPLAAIGGGIGVGLWNLARYAWYGAGKASNHTHASTFTAPADAQEKREKAVLYLQVVESELEGVNAYRNITTRENDCEQAEFLYSIHYFDSDQDKKYKELVRDVQDARVNLWDRHQKLQKILNRDAPLQGKSQ